MKNVAIYTAIYGEYDDLKPIPKGMAGYKFICFTDNKEWIEKGKVKGYEIRPGTSELEDNGKNSRRYKTLSHTYLPEFDFTVWVDGSIRLKPAFREYIEKNLRLANISMLTHPQRNCIYDEAEICIALKKDKKSIIEKQMKYYKEEGYPEDNGMVSAGIIVRNNNAEEIKKFNEEWWNQIQKYSRRDQLSFNYLIWKRKIYYNENHLDLFNNPYFTVEDESHWNPKFKK